MYLGVTGHRPSKVGGYAIPNPVYDYVVSEMQAHLALLRPQLVFTGMALGVDQWMAELCVSLGISFVAAIPFEGQETLWPPSSRSRYQWLLDKAAYKVIVSPGEYAPEKMQIRNVWIVDNVGAMLAVWDGTPGGTGNCVEYASRASKVTYRINPGIITSPTLRGPDGLEIQNFQGLNVPVLERVRRSIEATDRAAHLGSPAENAPEAIVRRNREREEEAATRRAEQENMLLESRAAQVNAILGVSPRRGAFGRIDMASLLEMETRISRMAQRRERIRARAAAQEAERAANEQRRSRIAAQRRVRRTVDVTTDDQLLSLLEQSVRTNLDTYQDGLASQEAPQPERTETKAEPRDPFIYKRMVDLDD